MNKFVFLSFIFMGWVFYELSGGSDFEPRVDPALTATPLTPLAIPKPVDPVEIVTTSLTLPAPKVPAATNATNRDVSSVRANEEPESTLPEQVDLTETSAVKLVSLEQGGEGFGGLLEGYDPNAIRLSASVTTETIDVAPEIDAEPELPPADIRTISANHVNMRNGPGTTYDVVTRLRLGEEVEVLGDSGSGWLRLRMVSNRTVGWISASLVSKPLR